MADEVGIEEPPMNIEDLPYECLVECMVHITSAEELCTVAQVSQTLNEASQADVLWRGLCIANQHGQSLDFRQALGEFGHPDAKSPTERVQPTAENKRGGSQGQNWRDVFRKSRDTMRTTICIDTGRGYAKYGLAASERPRIIQICQPGAEASQESLFPLAFRRLGLARADLSEHAAIIAEPFRLAHASMESERAAWRYEAERRILQGFQLKQVGAIASLPCLLCPPLRAHLDLQLRRARVLVAHARRCASSTPRRSASSHTRSHRGSS